MEKTFISAADLLKDSFRLASMVYEDGFRPEFIVGIWRGGAPIGIAVQEYFDYKQVPTDHIAVRTSSYYGINQQSKEIRVHGLHYLIENANADDGLLIVDDVFDTGRSVEAIITELSKQTRLNTPEDIRIAVPYYKPSRNQIDREPDYVVHETSDWLKYPHSLEGLSEEEMEQKRPEIYQIIKNYLPKKLIV